MSTAKLHPIRWQQGPLSFELETECPEIYERAESILAYWKTKSPGTAVSPETVRLLAERTDDGFVVREIGAHNPEPVYPTQCVLMRAVEAKAALAVINRPHLLVSIHGALLEQHGAGIIVVGPSQAGKSTLSCGLWANGWRLLADDMTIIDPETLTAEPVLRRVSLREKSREILGQEFWSQLEALTSCDRTHEGMVFHPEELSGEPRGARVPLRAIVFLQRQDAPPLEPGKFSRIESAPALICLAPYTNQLQQKQWPATLQRLAPLAGRVPVYDFGRGPIPAMLKGMDELWHHAAQ